MPKSVFNDFSGGITDFKFQTASNYSETLENWMVLRDKSIEVRHGFDFLDINAPRVTTNRRVNAVRDLSDTPVYFSEGNLYYINSGMQEIKGPTANNVFNLADANTITDVAQWGEHYLCTDDSYSFPQKVFKDENGNLRAVNAGLPQVISEPIITPSTDTGAKYIYAFVYEYTYRIGTTLYLDLGEPMYVEVTGGADSFSGSHTITNYLELTNGSERNYDTVNIKKRIYRTLNHGTTLYYVASIDNNITTYADALEDSILQTREVLYTQGGIKPNQQPPQAKYITVNNNVAYYGNIIESAETKPYRMRFSKIADVDSVPEDFFEDFESEITGLAAINDRVIVFTENKATALVGDVDDIGRGSYSRDTIADIGCVSNGSIITTQDWIYWFSDSGIHRTNGVEYKKLTLHLDHSYQLWTNNDTKKRRITGAYDKVNQRVYWCINESDSDNDKILVFDEIHNGFCKLSSGADFSPTAIMFRDQEMIRADKDGYVFVHKEDIYSDLIKDQFTPVANWARKAIPYDWKHIAWDMGDAERTKWINKIGVVGRPKTNVYLEPRSYREGSVDYFQLAPIKFNPLMLWGDPTLKWGDVANRWNSVDYLNQAKPMNRRAKRATHVQMSLASAYMDIQSSGIDTGSYIQINSVAKTASLVNPSVYSFSAGNEGYDLHVNGRAYKVISGSVDTLVLEDSEGHLVDGNYSYSIKGYPKAQRPHISTISIHYEVFGDLDKLQESVA